MSEYGVQGTAGGWDLPDGASNGVVLTTAAAESLVAPQDVFGQSTATTTICRLQDLQYVERARNSTTNSEDTPVASVVSAANPLLASLQLLPPNTAATAATTSTTAVVLHALQKNTCAETSSRLQSSAAYTVAPTDRYGLLDPGPSSSQASLSLTAPSRSAVPGAAAADAPHPVPQAVPVEVQPTEAPLEGSSIAQGFPPAWEELRREEILRKAGATAAAVRQTTRPGLCVCKKLAVETTLRDDGDSRISDGGGSGLGKRRVIRVCANRGTQAGCSFEAFADSPLIPSATVTSETRQLVLHVLDSAAPSPLPPLPQGSLLPSDACLLSFETVCPETRLRDGTGVVMLKLQGAENEEKRSYVRLLEKHVPAAIWCPASSAWEIPRASAQQLLALHRAVGFKVEEQGVLERLVKETSCSDKGKKVPIAIRKWTMDVVASVHCGDEQLRAAMTRMVPPELGQCHLSSDGSGPLIALQLAAAQLLVQSLHTLPGVSKVDGAADALAMLAKPPAVLVSTPVFPVTSSIRNCIQQTRQAPASSTYRRPMIAPVPIRAGNILDPSTLTAGAMYGGGRRGRAGTGGSKQRGSDFVAPFRAEVGITNMVRTAVEKDAVADLSHGERFSMPPSWNEAPLTGGGQEAGGGPLGGVRHHGKDDDDAWWMGFASPVACSSNAYQACSPRSTGHQEPVFKRQRVAVQDSMPGDLSPGVFGYVAPPVHGSLPGAARVLSAFSPHEEASGHLRPLSTGVRLPPLGSMTATGRLRGMPKHAISTGAVVSGGGGGGGVYGDGGGGSGGGSASLSSALTRSGASVLFGGAALACSRAGTTRPFSSSLCDE